MLAMVVAASLSSSNPINFGIFGQLPRDVILVLWDKRIKASLERSAKLAERSRQIQIEVAEGRARSEAILKLTEIRRAIEKNERERRRARDDDFLDRPK